MRTQREIAENLEIHGSRVSRNLTSLSKAGLIEEIQPRNLRRGRPIKQYRTTPLGNEILSLIGSRTFH